MMAPESYRKIVAAKLYDALTETAYDVYAEKLRGNEGGEVYSVGREAVAHFFVKKYGWTLDYCRSLNLKDLETLLKDEADLLNLPSNLQSVFDEAWDNIERFQFPDSQKQ